MAEFISIAAFNHIEPANQLAVRLQEAGFQSEVFDESMEQKWHLFQLDPHAHMRVRVPEPDFERAIAQLHQWEGNNEFLAQAVHCPECSSTLIEYPQFSRKTLLGALPAVAAAAGIIERDYYCNSCQFTWPAEKPLPEQEVDTLNWPKKRPV
ncbi:MAG: hypothetical protein V4710_11155 [Verrucomicrobiota bacterium]